MFQAVKMCWVFKFFPTFYQVDYIKTTFKLQMRSITIINNNVYPII